jgi:transcriptional regulator
VALRRVGADPLLGHVVTHPLRLPVQRVAVAAGAVVLDHHAVARRQREGDRPGVEPPQRRRRLQLRPAGRQPPGGQGGTHGAAQKIAAQAEVPAAEAGRLVGAGVDEDQLQACGVRPVRHPGGRHPVAAPPPPRPAAVPHLLPVEDEGHPVLLVLLDVPAGGPDHPPGGAAVDAVAVEPHTPGTITDPDRLRAVIGEVRDRGWTMVDGELEVGLRSVAAPIRGREGRTLAGISVSSFAPRVTLADLRSRCLPPLLETAGLISTALSGRASL